jgi:hypothetical protein
MLRTRLVPTLLALAVTAVPAGALAAGSGGVSGPAFYVDGALYRTVNTPTDLSHTGAPDSSFETIYDFGGLQPNVAEAGPGQPGFKGGRWQVRPLAFNDSYAATVLAHDANASGDLDSNEEVDGQPGQVNARTSCPGGGADEVDPHGVSLALHPDLVGLAGGEPP